MLNLFELARVRVIACSSYRDSTVLPTMIKDKVMQNPVFYPVIQIDIVFGSRKGALEFDFSVDILLAQFS